MSEALRLFVERIDTPIGKMSLLVVDDAGNLWAIDWTEKAPEHACTASCGIITATTARDSNRLPSSKRFDGRDWQLFFRG